MSDAYQSEEPATIGQDLIWGAPGLAAELNIPVTRADYLIRRKYVPARKIGGLWAISRQQLRAKIYGPDESAGSPRLGRSRQDARRRRSAASAVA
jgi:hypothetical protein